MLSAVIFVYQGFVQAVVMVGVALVLRVILSGIFRFAISHVLMVENMILNDTGKLRNIK